MNEKGIKKIFDDIGVVRVNREKDTDPWHQNAIKISTCEYTSTSYVM